MHNQFCYIHVKVGFDGVFIAHTCYPDEVSDMNTHSPREDINTQKNWIFQEEAQLNLHPIFPWVLI